MPPSDPSGLPPLKHAHDRILLALAERDLHGYAIRKDVAAAMKSP